MRPRPLWQKLLLGLLPLLFLVSAAFGLGAYGLARTRLLQGIQRDVEARAARLGSEFASFFADRRDDLSALAGFPLFKDCLAAFRSGRIDDGERDLKEIEAYLVQFSRRARVYERVSFLDKAGRELAAVEFGRPARERRDRDAAFVSGLKKGPWDSGIQTGPAGPTVTLAAPLGARAGEVEGAVVLECGLAPVLESMNRAYAGPGGGATVEQSGRILLGRRLELEAPLVASAPIEGTPWQVVLTADSAEYLAPLRDFSRWIGGLVLLTMALIPPLVAWAVKRGLEPLEKMEEGSKRLAAGDLGYRFEEPDSAELKTLAAEFNDLAKGLQLQGGEIGAKVAELRALHATLESSQRQLVDSEKLRAMGRLIAGIAHELNNPLQNVAGYSELLATSETPASAADLRRIHENARLCCRIIENLLLFVRQGKVTRRAIHVDEAVRASLELLDYRLRKTADVKVTVRLPDDLPRVRADFQQVEQVLVNLVSNSCDAMSAQNGPRSLAIEASAQGDVVRVEVADSGPGIPAGILANIFEPFFTSKPEGQGTGLGLSICKQIIEEHGGRIGCENRTGGGTTFWFELPVFRAAEGPAESGSRPPKARGASILVVDDDPDLLDLLRRALEGSGHRVRTARSAVQADTLVADSPFDLVVTDLVLGNASGLALHDQWQLRSRHPRPPFLVITGDVLNASTSEAIKARGLGIMYKPVTLEALDLAVGSLLGQAQVAG